MKSTHPLYGAGLRFERADRHLSEADGLIREFGEACKDRIEIDTKGRIRRLKGWPQIPPMLPVVISDAVHNLRAAMDYTVFELARLDSGTIQTGTQFIIEDAKTDPKDKNGGFDGRSKRCLKGLLPAHVKMIEQLQPYNGVEWTRMLRDLSNPDKHRTLTALTSTGRSIEVRVSPNTTGRYGARLSIGPGGKVLAARFDIEVSAHQAITIAPADPAKPSLMAALRAIEAETLRAVELFAREF